MGQEGRLAGVGSSAILAGVDGMEEVVEEKRERILRLRPDAHDAQDSGLRDGGRIRTIERYVALADEAVPVSAAITHTHIYIY